MTLSNNILFSRHTMTILVRCSFLKKLLMLMMISFFRPISLKFVPNFFPKMNKLVETPLDDHSRSLYTALIHKHYSLAQLNFIIAKLSSFILKN